MKIIVEEEKTRETDQNPQDRISPSPKCREGEEEVKEEEVPRYLKANTYPKSLKSYYFFRCVKKEEPPPSPLNLAYLGDALIIEAQIFTAEKLSGQLGYKIKTRKQITNYRARKAPKIRIGKHTYYFIKS